MPFLIVAFASLFFIWMIAWVMVLTNLGWQAYGQPIQRSKYKTRKMFKIMLLQFLFISLFISLCVALLIQAHIGICIALFIAIICTFIHIFKTAC